MPEFTRQDTQNIYKLARISAGKSRMDAAWELHMSDRTLARVELDESTPDPDTVLKMEEVYGDRSLTAKHCAYMCPIGKKYASPVEESDLPAAALGVIKELNDLRPYQERLICIASNGTVDDDEKTDFEKILHEMNHLIKKIKAIKLWAARALGMEITEKKEKKPLSAAAM